MEVLKGKPSTDSARSNSNVFGFIYFPLRKLIYVTHAILDDSEEEKEQGRFNVFYSLACCK